MIKEKLEMLLLLICALITLLFISVLHAVGILKVDDEYGF